MRNLKSLLLAGAALTAIAGSAFAADLTPQFKAPSFGSYVKGGCGWYFGLNSMGSTNRVTGGIVGENIVQGDLGVTAGYGCPIGTTPGSFWFAEGNFDWAGLNGATNGLALTGPAHLEQRVGLGSPISTMLSMFPGLNGLSVPAMPALPQGITAGPSFPFVFVSLHERDISAQLGVASNREWLFSPGIGVGLESRLSNAVVAETAVQYLLDSNGMAVGPVNSVKFGNGVEVSFTLKY
jgi:opacity protein-like surface antigen